MGERKRRAEAAKARMGAIRTGDVPFGRVSDYLRELLPAVLNVNVRVNCGNCNACCRDPNLHVELTEEECARYPDAYRMNGRYWLPKQANGSCAHFKEGKCSIYDTRPQSCRLYDCRMHVLSGCINERQKLVIEAMSRWSNPETPTEEDKIAACAVRMACLDAMSNGQDDVVAYAVLAYERYLPAARAFADRFNRLPEHMRQQITDAFGAAATAQLR